MAEIVLEMKCSLERLREENSRLHEETKTNRLQAQERFDAATGVLKHENHSLRQNLESAECALEQAKAAAEAALAESTRLQAQLDRINQKNTEIIQSLQAVLDDAAAAAESSCLQAVIRRTTQQLKQIDAAPAPAAPPVALPPPSYVPAEKGQASGLFTNVMVRNIRDDVTDEQLAAAFASCGKITSAVVHREANGKSKRHGFVNFELPEAAVKCIEQFNDSESLATPGDRILVVRHLRRSEYHRQSELAAMGGADKAPFQGTNLYVKYLDDSVTDEELREMFAGCGQVTSAKVEMDKEKGISKGFGYVNFSTPEEATKAVTEMNGKTVGSKPLYVCLHMSREQRVQFALSQGMRQNNFRQPMYNPGMMPFSPGMMGQLPYGQQFTQNRMMNNMARPVAHNMMGMNQGPGGLRNPAFMAPGHNMAVRPHRVSAGVAPAMGAAPRPAGTAQPQAVFKQQARNVPSAAPGAPVAVAPAPNKNDLAAMLAQATPEQQKQMLGERLYMLIVPTQSQLAGKITGMLLEGLDTAELLGLVESPLALDEKIKLALEELQKHALP